MSMKIYNAYRLKGDYDLISLNEFCDNLRKEVTKISEQMALDWVANKTLYYYNFKKLHGSQVVQDMIKETKNSKEMHETWKLVDVDRWDYSSVSRWKWKNREISSELHATAIWISSNHHKTRSNK